MLQSVKKINFDPTWRTRNVLDFVTLSPAFHKTLKVFQKINDYRLIFLQIEIFEGRVFRLFKYFYDIR